MSDFDKRYDEMINETEKARQERKPFQLYKELDGQIAEKVMGEPKPTKDPEYSGPGRISEGGNWEGTLGPIGSYAVVWIPRRFSSDLGQAMRAVDKYLNDQPKGSRPVLQMDYDAIAKYPPETICNLLLALVEDD